MKNVFKKLWDKFFGKKEEPTLEAKIDLGLQAYMNQQNAIPEPTTVIPNIEPQVITLEIPKPKETIEQILAPEVEVKAKRKYTKKAIVAPIKKAPAKKMPAKKVAIKKTTPTKKASTKKVATKKTNKK